MAKYGDGGLGLELVKAVNSGEIIEPLTFEKIKLYCTDKNIEATENHMRVILPNASENDHSPFYRKYFKRVGRGEYVILDEFRTTKNFYWLNLNSQYAGWSFSDLKVGRSQEYFNVNEDGSKRRNQSCFEDIIIGDKALAYETASIKGITSICEVSDKYYKNNKIVVIFKKIKDFSNFLLLEEMKKFGELEDCKLINSHQGTLFNIEKEYFDVIDRMLEKLNPVGNYYEDLDKEVEKSREISSKERKKRLANKENLIPERIQITTSGFKRDANVIAEVLERANGKCEKCKSDAPFIRKINNTPYLEVHHKVRLADGGEDTVENAIAVCPNCHRELHFG